MSRVCYGQNFEDVVLWRALGHVVEGRYLDIGAQHPEIDSVSKSFYLAGWRGVHVEPTFAYAEALRADRPDELVIQAAAGDQMGLVRLFEFPDTGLSTAVAGVAAEIASAGHSFREIQVPSISLDALLEHFDGSPLHWLKIDVEGMESSVLRSWSTSKTRPWVVIIESIAPTTRGLTDGDWRDLIEARGYHEVLFDGVNRFFVADEQRALDAAFDASANCIDNFMVPVHHWVAANVVHHFSNRASVADATINERDEQIALMDKTSSALSRELQTERGHHQAAIQANEGRIAHFERVEAELIEQSESLTAQLDASVRTSEERATQFATIEADLITLSRSLTAQLGVSAEQIGALAHQLGASAERISVTQGQLDAARTEQVRLDVLAATTIDSLRHDIAGVQSELSARGQRLAEADRIIRLARDRVIPWPVRVANVLFSHGKTSTVHAALAGWFPLTLSDGNADSTPSNPKGHAMDMFSRDDRNPYLRVDTVAELCTFSDINFVRCAFVTILGRQPDVSGEAAYTRSLRAGMSKLAIINDLRRSPEGRQHDPGIVGLDRALRKFRNANRPFLGWLIRQVTGRAGNSPVERSLRMLQNDFATDRQMATQRFAHLNHFVENIDHKIDALEKVVRSAIGRGLTSPSDIADAEAEGDGNWKSSLYKVLDS